MSIINDALKKTGEYVQQDHGAAMPNVNKTKKTYLIYILVILAGLVIGNFTLNYFARKTAVKEKSVALISVAPSSQALGLPQNDAPEQNDNLKPETGLTLNGIFLSDEDGYALINNQIIKVDDTIGSAKVTKISAETVELLDAEGKTITLSTRNH